MVWIAIYPSITLMQVTLGKQLIELPVPLRTLVMTLLLVPLMVFILLPLLRKLLHTWLNK